MFLSSELIFLKTACSPMSDPFWLVKIFHFTIAYQCSARYQDICREKVRESMHIHIHIYMYILYIYAFGFINIIYFQFLCFHRTVFTFPFSSYSLIALSVCIFISHAKQVRAEHIRFAYITGTIIDFDCSYYKNYFCWVMSILIHIQKRLIIQQVILSNRQQTVHLSNTERVNSL